MYSTVRAEDGSGPAWAGGAGSSSCSRSARSTGPSAAGSSTEKLPALSHDARHLQCAAHGLGQPLGQGQAQAGALDPGLLAAEALEGHEQLVDGLRGDPGAAVGHLDLEPLGAGGPAGQLDPAAGAVVLDRVGEQVEQHLLEPPSFDCHDESAAGRGTAGRSNSWTANVGRTSSPRGLCAAPSGDVDTPGHAGKGHAKQGGKWHGKEHGKHRAKHKRPKQRPSDPCSCGPLFPRRI
jgi:hypothetical protein